MIKQLLQFTWVLLGILCMMLPEIVQGEYVSLATGAAKFTLTPIMPPTTPSLSISDVTNNEGNAGTTSFVFTVSLSAPAPAGGVSFNYATANGTAVAPGDYTSSSGTGYISAGNSVITITVLVNGDFAYEPNETFFVNLSSATNATISDSQGLGTIVNDDAAPNLTINDVSHAEGNTGTTSFVFTVSLSAAAPAGGVTFDIATADGTAIAPGDYTAKSLTGQTIPEGSYTYSFTVLVNGDYTIESAETFLVNVSNATNATVSDGQGQGTIFNDDVTPNLIINDVSLNEGNSGTTAFTFTVSLVAPPVPAALSPGPRSARAAATPAPAPTGGVTFDIATADGTAIAPGDYTAKSLTNQTIPEGSSTYSFTVLVNGDVTFEPDETFFVNVTNVTNANVLDGQGQGTIVNDDVVPPISAVLAGTSTICSGQSATLTTTITNGTSPYSLTISDGSSTSVITGYTSGASIVVSPAVNTTYTLVALTDASSVSASPENLSGTANVVIDAVTASLNPSAATLTCSQPVISLTATGGSSYTLSDSQTNTTGLFTVDQPGTYTVVVTTASGCTATATTTIDIDKSSPEADLEADGPLSCTNTTVTLYAYPAEQYNYVFSAGATQVGSTNTATVSQAGEYSVIITGTNGCTVSASVFVEPDNTLPETSLEASGPLSCTTTTVTLYAYPTEQTNYVFSAGATQIESTNTATVSQAGNYSVIITGANGCTASASVTVNADQTAPSVSINPSSATLTCASPSVSLTAVGTGTVRWEDNSTNAVRNVSASGTYSVTLTGTSGCVASTSVVIGQDNTAPSISINPSSTTLTCASPSVSLTAVGTGTVRWEDNSTNAIRTVSSSGTYSVTLTGTSGCVASTSVVIGQDNTAPSISINPSSTTLTCASPSVSLTAVGTGTVRWEDNSTNAIRTVSSSGTYSVTLTGTSGCVASTSVVIGQDNTAPSISINPSSTTLTCASPSVSLTAVGTGTVRWEDNSTNAIRTVNASGTYSVTLTGTNGCVASTSVVIGQDNTTPSVSINPSSATLTCASPSVSLTAVGTGTVRWDDNSTNAIRTVSSSGTYSVTLTSANGCVASASVVIGQDNTAPSVSINPSSATLTCASPSVSLTAVGTGTVLWSTNETTPIITVNTGNTYSVTLTNGNGCMATAQITVSSSTSLAAPTLTASALSTSNQPISVTATGCAGGTINWTVLGGTGLASGNVYTLTQPGSYTLSASCSIGECVSQTSQALNLSIQPGGPFRLIAPTYNCSTGAITFNTTGGDGTLIEYFAIGITPWTTHANQTIEAGLRGDPKVILLQAQQSGVMVSYSFDLPAFCASLQPPPPPIPNQPPVVTTTITTQTAILGSAYTFALPAGLFTDPENQTLSYSALGLPAGLTLVGTTLVGTPTAEGFTTVTIIAQDPGGLTANTSFGLSVLPLNPQPPTGGGLTLLTPLYNCESGAITFLTSGGNGSPVEYFAIGVTGWTSQANQTVDAGLRSDPKVLTLHARQNGVEAATLDFDLKAYCSGPPVNRPPLLVTAISNQTALVNQSYSFVISSNTFSDPETGPLTYSISGLPAGLNASGLTISGTPSQTGVSTVKVLAIDNGGLTATTSFLLTVVPTSTTTVSPPPGGPLALIAPIYDCATGAITFQTTGGNGSTIEYMAIGVTGWTTNPNQHVEAGLRADPKPLTLQARQSGTEVTYNFDLPNACPKSGRVMAEATTRLSVAVLGNPVTTDRLKVEVRGALGESLHVQLIGGQGLSIQELRLETAMSVESFEFEFSRPAGLYLLKVSTPTQQQVVKIIKQ